MFVALSTISQKFVTRVLAIMMVLGLLTINARADARLYLFQFDRGAETTRSSSDNERQLASMIDLLVRQGVQADVSFQIVGTVTQCPGRGGCQEEGLLKRRVQILVGALRKMWPRGVDEEPLRRLTWSAAQGDQAYDADQLLLVLASRAFKEGHTECAERVEIFDPELPGAINDPKRSVWRSVDWRSVVPVSPKARFRVSSGPDLARRVPMWARVEEKIWQLDARAEGSGQIYDLDFPGNTLVVSSQRPEIVSKQQAQTDERAVGDQLRPWTAGRIQDGRPLSSAHNSVVDACSLKFERWVPEARAH